MTLVIHRLKNCFCDRIIIAQTVGNATLECYVMELRKSGCCGCHITM